MSGGLGLASVAPPNVILEVAHPEDADPAALFPDERHLTRNMAPVRLHEFASGRNAARRALAALGLSRGALLPAPGERYVAWPVGILGSLSHTRGLCAVAVARTPLVVDGRAVVGLGIDVEPAAPLDTPLVDEICRPGELAALAAVPPPPSGWPRLLFVIKESVYKAWYPVTHIPLEFHQVELTIDPASRRFSATVHAVQCDHATELSGRYTHTPTHILALALMSGLSSSITP